MNPIRILIADDDAGMRLVMRKLAENAEGGSALEDVECAGGSMPHRHTQGVSREAQSRRLEELDHRREAEDEDRLVPTAIDARALRRAVVMAEVLGKPRAMRKTHIAS